MADRRSTMYRLLDTARMMLDGNVGAIDGSRVIVRLVKELGDDGHPVLLPFIGIASESDRLVVGDDRSLWSPAFLADVDREYREYEHALRPQIAALCRALLAAFEPRLRECPACGYSPLAREPYGATGDPSYERCPCCEFQPGITDAAGYDAAEWRRRWVAKGTPFRQAPGPAGWNAIRQLSEAGLDREA